MSLARLRILFPPTCVGFRYGYPLIRVKLFLGGNIQPIRLARRLNVLSPLLFPTRGSGRRRVQPSISNRSGGLPFRVTSPRLCHQLGSAGIFNLLSIAYASRPRLRVRLTLGGRAFPRKPWVFGVPNSHRDYRYSCRACSLPCRPAVLSVHLHPAWNAPLPPADQCPGETPGWNGRAAASVVGLSPDHLRREIARLVSCYALFKWWLPLSQHPSCLCDSTSSLT